MTLFILPCALLSRPAPPSDSTQDATRRPPKHRRPRSSPPSWPRHTDQTSRDGLQRDPVDATTRRNPLRTARYELRLLQRCRDPEDDRSRKDYRASDSRQFSRAALFWIGRCAAGSGNSFARLVIFQSTWASLLSAAGVDPFSLHSGTLLHQLNAQGYRLAL